MKKYLFIPITVCILIACQNQYDEGNIESPVDSLVLNWASNWNNHDSIALINMFDKDAVLFDNNIVTRNPEELFTKMIRPYYNILSDMKIEKIQEWVTEDRAGFSGTWTVDIIVNDTTLRSTKGAFTCVWKKAESGDWKVTNAHISDFNR